MLLLSASVTGRSQTAKVTTADADRLVREWFRRLNALDDWFITVDGKEEPEGVVDQMVEMYTPEAMQFMGPGEEQIGTVAFSGQEGIRKWADGFARKHVQLAYRLQDQTLKEQTANVVMSAVPPWGGVAASVEFTAFYGERESRRRFFGPGIAVFQFNDEGKIGRLRIYVPKDELQEVVP